MKDLLSEKSYKRISTDLNYSKQNGHKLNLWLKDPGPLINSEAFNAAQLLVKLAIEKINQHNGIIERKLTALKKVGFIDAKGDKCFY